MEIVHIRQKKLQKGYRLYLDYVSPTDGKRHKRYLNLHINDRDKENTLKTMALANKYKQELETELLFPNENLPLFVNYARSIDEAELSPNTQRNRITMIRVVEDFDPNVNVGEINRAWMAKFIKFMIERGNSPISISNRVSIIKGVLRHAYKDGLIFRIPDFSGRCPKVVSKPRDFLTLDEIKRLSEVSTYFEIYKKAFLFCCFTGLRWSDMLRFQYANIRDGVLSITMQKKTKRFIQIPLTENAKAFLPPHKRSPFVFGEINKHSAFMNRLLKRLCKEAKIYKKISFHCTRHTFAVISLESCENLYTVSQLLGHTTVRATQVYAKCLLSDKIKALNPLLPHNNRFGRPRHKPHRSHCKTSTASCSSFWRQMWLRHLRRRLNPMNITK